MCFTITSIFGVVVRPIFYSSYFCNRYPPLAYATAINTAQTDSSKDEEERGYNLDPVVNTFDGENDYAASEFPFTSRVMHFLRGEKIARQNRLVVEVALLIECGAYVVNLGTMTNEDKFARTKERYL